jgi:hypothetical protein
MLLLEIGSNLLLPEPAMKLLMLVWLYAPIVNFLKRMDPVAKNVIAL